VTPTAKRFFEKIIDVPVAQAKTDLVLSLEKIDDFDLTTLNGECVGGSPDAKPGQWNVDRVYTVPGRLV